MKVTLTAFITFNTELKVPTSFVLYEWFEATKPTLETLEILLFLHDATEILKLFLGFFLAKRRVS